VGFRVKGLRFRVQSLGFRGWGVGLGAQGLRFMVWVLGFGVEGLGFRDWGSEVRVQGVELMAQVTPRRWDAGGGLSAQKGGGGGHTGWGEGIGWRGGEGEELAGVRGGGMRYLRPDRRGGVGGT